MQHIKIFAFIAVLPLLLAGCQTSTEPDLTEEVYPMYVDNNGNDINDYVEQETHEPAPENSSAKTDFPATSHGGPGHSFVDANDDGICDYAQDGSPTWHGPGFVDKNDNGICDYWDESHSMHNRHAGMHYIDENDNHINDHFEKATHRSKGHNFRDRNEDGICDFAQDGSPSWHGPGFVDDNGNGMSDHWESGGRGHGGRMGGHHR